MTGSDTQGGGSESADLAGPPADAPGAVDQPEWSGRLGPEDYRALYDNSPDGVLFSAPDGRILAASPAACRILGRSEEELCRIGRQPMMDPDDARWITLLEERARTGRVHGVAAMIRGDGARIEIEMNARMFTNRLGQVRSCTIIRDVTARLEAEKRLAAAGARFRTLFESAPTCTLLLDREGRVVAANQAAEILLGCTGDELCRHSMFELLHPEDRAASMERLERLWRREVPSLRSEKRYLHALGHTVWVQAEKRLIRAESGDEMFVLEQAQDISDRRRHEEDLQHLATHDVLTGLLNRRGLLAELDRQAAEAHRYGTAGALLVVDLDHFKYVNDTLGHKAGDELIVRVGDLICKRVRETDIVARLGGDEFAVLLPHGGLEAAAEVADAIISVIAADPAMDPAGGLPVTASIGVAEFLDTFTAEEVMQAADLALYDAKDAGRNQIARYQHGASVRPRTEARIKWITQLREALANDDLQLYAQPIINVDTGEAVLYELLLRLPAAGGVVIPPSAFLYIAERFDLVQEIDRWVIAQAAAALGADSGLALTINLSGKSLAEPQLLEHLADELSRRRVAPERLVLEITETAAVAQINHARWFAQQARELGCRIAIDDFGAGFGSFYYLKNLPIDYLKIDGEFVANAAASPADALIVQTIRDLAHGLGHGVIAEHCCDEQTHEWLTEHGITLHQGYHHAPPKPLAAALGGARTSPGPPGD